ncbi:MAG: outer membrane beta-barrel protein [Deltaproteobacteria bacterium]|nr:outer membrane beta-barrel protein [Deltaproteobacteria bacterium]
MKPRCLLATLASALIVMGSSSADACRIWIAPRAGFHGHVNFGGGIMLAPGYWYTGLGLAAVRILDQAGGTEQLESGGGVSLYAGVRLNEVLSLELGWLASFHNPTRINTWYGPDVDFLVLDGGTFDARVHLSPSERFDPYLTGGLGLYTLSSEHFGIDSIGSGFQVGGGFDYWIASVASVGIRVRFHGISMDAPDSRDDTLFISAASAEGAVTLHF